MHRIICRDFSGRAASLGSMVQALMHSDAWTLHLVAQGDDSAQDNAAMTGSKKTRRMALTLALLRTGMKVRLACAP